MRSDIAYSVMSVYSAGVMVVVVGLTLVLDLVDTEVEVWRYDKGERALWIPPKDLHAALPCNICIYMGTQPLSAVGFWIYIKSVKPIHPNIQFCSYRLHE